MSVLMLRGPQYWGELKQRSERMHAFRDLAGVHETLTALIGRGLCSASSAVPGTRRSATRNC